MSTNNDTRHTTPPQGFTPAEGFSDDEGPATLWQHKGIDVFGTLSIGAYWEPDEGITYTLSVPEGNRPLTLADLKAAHSELDLFIRRAEQVEGL